MRSHLFLAVLCALALAARGATVEEMDDQGQPAAPNRKAMDEILGMITGNEEAPARRPGDEEKKGPVGGDWAIKREEEKRKEEAAKKKVQEKRQRYVSETRREREEMERDRKRILELVEADKGERRHKFVFVEPEATTALPAPEPPVTERRAGGDWGTKLDEARRREKELADKAKQARERYVAEKKREKEAMERERRRINEFIQADKGERKHRFVYPEPRPEEETSPATTEKPQAECKLTLKFSDGSVKVREYSPREQLAAVRLYIRFEHPSVPFSKIALSSAGKQFTGPMMKETLSGLDLCPTSELEVTLG